MKRRALLALEDGRLFEGEAFGADGERAGELVFNTSMTGYQEVLTDPSYKGQIVAMTYPLIGNYGINEDDGESRRAWLEGFVVRELSQVRSNWRSTKDLDTFLGEQGVPGIQGVDTRALTRHLRTAGAMRSVLSTTDLDPKSLVAKAKASPGLEGVDLVKRVTCDAPYDWDPQANAAGPRVAVMDYGVKFGILRRLLSEGCRVRVYPAATPPDELVADKPDGVMLSNGPGDPAAVTYAITHIRRLIEEPPGGRPLPLFGICLGQQLLGLALGGRTFKLKFGHHGANHPVKDLRTERVAITVQNHGFNVDMESLDQRDVEVTHLNLNDRTLEGLEHRRLPLFSVQFHPEASPGPHDAHYLFKRFVELMLQRRSGSQGVRSLKT